MRPSEELIDEMFDNGILVKEIREGLLKAISIKKRKTVYIDNELIESEKEKRTILLHERGHFDSDYFYNLNSVMKGIRNKETRTTRKLIKKELPLEKLNKLLSQFEYIYEIADEVCLTEDFINQAIDYYKDQGLL